MSENLHLSAMGLLRPADIGGEACEGCEHNERGKSCALVFGGRETLRACADLLFEDCEIVPIGTKARLAELETELPELRDILIEILDNAVVNGVYREKAEKILKKAREQK